MDRFLQYKSQKHTSQIFAINVITCLYGRPGCGKTRFVQIEYPSGYISIEADILKNRQDTLDMFERLKYSEHPIVIDDWEAVSDLIGVREINGAISSKSPTIIISHTPVKLTPLTVFYECPIYRPDNLSNQQKQTYNGDARRLIHELTGDPDVFETPRDYVCRLMRGDWKHVKPGDIVHEHGHVWGIVQENYPDRTNENIETAADIAEMMSQADLTDTNIYSSADWQVAMPLFTIDACIAPCRLMKASLVPPRTGSMWTKYQNMCMRRKKFDTLVRRQQDKGLVLDHTALALVIRQQFLQEDFTACREYRLEPADIDVLAHIIGPFRPRIINLAKKMCTQT